MSIDPQALDSLAAMIYPDDERALVPVHSLRLAFKAGWRSRDNNEPDLVDPVVIDREHALQRVEAGKPVYGIPEADTYRFITDLDVALAWARRLGVSSIANWATLERIEVTP